MPETVAILGASDDPTRYANRAMHALLAAGHEVLLVNPMHREIDGRPVFDTVGAAAAHAGPIDTVTVYVNPRKLATLADDLVAAAPRRVILNPGTESMPVRERLEAAGIEVQEACTLVLLSLDAF